MTLLRIFIKIFQSLHISISAVLAARAVPGSLVQEPLLDRAVPDHDAQQVLSDGLRGELHDVRGLRGALRPDQDLSCGHVDLARNVRGGFTVILLTVMGKPSH